MHILVIEDHDPMARTIEAILVADQHTVARAADGRAGMALSRSSISISLSPIS
ncbi:MAG: response regulator transcription factor [Alphaproteobacteria bacterium]|nr:response regulator transcription factor [Alphaproteobacteria bacterium]